MFKDPAGKALIRDWHEKFRAKINQPTEERLLETLHGQTHVLITGPVNAPALVVLHGALASSAHVLPELGNLIQDHRIYAIDVVGQSVMSEDRRLEMKDDSYAQWLRQVLDALGVDRIDLLGVSWGGWVALNFATTFPDRLKKLVLVMPAGVVNGSAWRGFIEAGWPIMKFLRKPSDENLDAAVKGQFTTIDPDWRRFFGDALLNYKLDVRIPPLYSDVRLTEIKSPVLVFGAEHDLSFPGQKLIARIQKVLPDSQTELVINSKHCPPFTDEHRNDRAARIRRFLA